MHLHFQVLSMRFNSLLALLAVILLSSCAEQRIHEEKDWDQVFSKYGISNACFIMRDHTHEEIFYHNKERCIRRFTPASTFKIFSSLVALETSTAPDEQYIIKWDSVVRWSPLWSKDMGMREAFKVSNVGYYQELVRRIGKDYMQHYLDTVRYGNQRIGPAVDMFWLNDTLQISADEQLGFVKKLYFDELPFSERSQRIVRSMMLQEQTPDYKLYYKTGAGSYKDSMIYWIVGFAEKIVQVKEPKKSMNKSDVRNYPFFFAQNFSVPEGDTSKDWAKMRVDVLHDILRSRDIIRDSTH